MSRERLFPAQNAHRLDDPERRTYLPPEAVIGRLGITPGMQVADIGAGTGYLTLPLAAAVGPEGAVTAVEPQEAMRTLLRTKLDQPGAPHTVTLLEGTAEQLPLSDAAFDLLLLVNVWHEVDGQETALREARRALGPEGRLAILDWRADLAPPPGPPPDHRIPAEQVVRTLTAAGWRTGYPDLIGTYSYLVIASPEPLTSKRTVLSQVRFSRRT